MSFQITIMKSGGVWEVILPLQGTDTQVIFIACIPEQRDANLKACVQKSLCDELSCHKCQKQLVTRARTVI